MTKVVRHLKQNVIAYLALFVALGGTSYAAISIPRNSVGAKQIRNHSIDPVKLDRKAFAGYVRLWARVDANGNLIASSPKAKVVSWYPPGSTFHGGQIQWPVAASTNCIAMANAESAIGPSYASTMVAALGKAGGTTVLIRLSDPTAADVVVICPQP